MWGSHVQCILKQYSRFCYFIFIFQWTESFGVAQVSRGQIIYVWFWFLERRKARTTGGQSQILRLSRNQNQIYFPGLTFSRDVVLWVGYCRIDTPVLDKDLSFIYCFGFLNVFSRSLLERMNNHTCYISFPFLHCVFSNGSSEHFYKRMLSRTGCIYLCLLKCLFSCLLKLPASEYA